MAEKPILFSGPMIRAILAGTKTQTRRLCKLAYDEHGAPASHVLPARERGWITIWGRALRAEQLARGYADGRPCPYGAPGDRLYVREKWHPCDGGPIYAADHESAAAAGVERWCPSIHMRREDSRITLEVTGVRVERLQDITEEDARAEGVAAGRIAADEDGPERIGFVLGDEDGRCTLYPSARSAFEVGWDAINGKRAPWASNPWVWVVSFRRAALAKDPAT